jgi:hypothetical protein
MAIDPTGRAGPGRGDAVGMRRPPRCFGPELGGGGRGESNIRRAQASESENFQVASAPAARGGNAQLGRPGPDPVGGGSAFALAAARSGGPGRDRARSQGAESRAAMLSRRERTAPPAAAPGPPGVAARCASVMIEFRHRVTPESPGSAIQKLA